MGIGDILYVFTNLVRITQVMVLLDKTVVKLLLDGAPNLKKFNRLYDCQVSGKVALLNFNDVRFFSIKEGIGRVLLSRREDDQTFCFQQF